MLVAGAQVFAVVTVADAAVLRSYVVAVGGAVVAGGRVVVGCLQRVGDSVFRGDYGEDLRLVRRQLR
jgi:hypothetical protein